MGEDVAAEYFTMSMTVAEIGRIVGCSSATVSRVMNASGPVNPQIREAVLAEMARTGYRRGRTGRRGRPAGTSHNSHHNGLKLVELLYFRDSAFEKLTVEKGAIDVAAQQLANEDFLTGSSHELASSFYRQIVDGTVQELTNWNYRGVIRFSSDLGDASTIAEVNKPDHAGLLLMGQYSTKLTKFVESCAHPLVLVDLIHNGPVDCVTTDNAAGISLGFNHLYNLGHRRIGFIGRCDEIGGFAERFSAFKFKLAEAELALVPEWVSEGPNRIDHAEAGTLRILKSNHRPTAIMCANDCAAIGAVRAAHQLKIRVPEELSIVGFDDADFASLVMPPLTTVRTPTFEIGRQAVRQLMLQIQHPSQRSTRVRLMPELVVRSSSGPVPSLLSK